MTRRTARKALGRAHPAVPAPRPHGHLLTCRPGFSMKHMTLRGAALVASLFARVCHSVPSARAQRAARSRAGSRLDAPLRSWGTRQACSGPHRVSCPARTLAAAASRTFSRRVLPAAVRPPPSECPPRIPAQTGRRRASRRRDECDQAGTTDLSNSIPVAQEMKTFPLVPSLGN